MILQDILLYVLTMLLFDFWSSNIFPALEPLRNKTIDNVWKWPWQRDYSYDSMPVVTSRKSLEEERNGNARARHWEKKNVEKDALHGAKEWEYLTSDGEQWYDVI